MRTVFTKSILAAFLLLAASSVFADWVNKPIIKWNAQTDRPYFDDPTSACVDSVRYYQNGDLLYAAPRPEYPDVQYNCYVGVSGAAYWASVVLLMGSCDGGKTYNQAVTTCTCPINSKEIKGSCKCNSGYVDNPTGNRTCSRLVILEDTTGAGAGGNGGGYGGGSDGGYGPGWGGGAGPGEDGGGEPLGSCESPPVPPISAL